MERSRTPKDNIKPNSDSVVLEPITASRNNGRLKRGRCILTRHKPQAEQKKSLMDFPCYGIPFNTDSHTAAIMVEGYWLVQDDQNKLAQMSTLLTLLSRGKNTNYV